MNPLLRPLSPAVLLALAGAFAHAAVDPAELDQAFGRLPQIQYGQDRAGLATIDSAVTAANADTTLRRQLEQRFIRVLQSDATSAAKDYACRALKLIGTADSVPALGALLANAELAGLARYALEQIPGPSADRALREALPRLAGKLQIGVISSLGFRRDAQAIPALRKLLAGSDEAAVRAAAFALGRIGTADAARALGDALAKATDALRVPLSAAYVDAGDNLVKQGQLAAAAKIFETLWNQNSSGYLRLAAFQGLVAARPSEADQRLLSAISGSDATLRQFAGQLVAQRPDRGVPRVLLDRLGKLPPEGQVVLLGALRTRQETSARPAVLPLLDATDVPVRVAALEALAAVGNAADVPTLAQRAAATGPEADVARKALANLRGPDVNAAIVAALSSAESPVRVQLLRGLSARSARETAGAVLPFVADADETVSLAALETLGNVGAEREVPELVRRLTTAKTDSQREEVASALEAIAGRVREKAGDPVLAGLAAGEPATRAALLRVLVNVGGTRALAAVAAATRETDAKVRDTAIRSLADWPDAGAAPELLRVLRSADNAATRVLAFRGYVRLARESEAAAEARLGMLTEAMALAQSADEKKLVLGALGDVSTADALQLTARHLTDAELADEAGAAVVKIASAPEMKNKPAVVEALQQVLQHAKAKSVLDAAQKQLQRSTAKPK